VLLPSIRPPNGSIEADSSVPAPQTVKLPLIFPLAFDAKLLPSSKSARTELKSIQAAVCLYKSPEESVELLKTIGYLVDEEGVIKVVFAAIVKLPDAPVKLIPSPAANDNTSAAPLEETVCCNFLFVLSQEIALEE
jgi:hypothetical protein